MERILLWGLALIPSLLVLRYIYTRDQFPEPRALRVRTFLLGFLLCAPVLLLGALLMMLGGIPNTGSWSQTWWVPLLWTAIPEELCKFLLLSLYVRRKAAFNEPLDGVVYGVTASLGFAMLENLLFATLGRPAFAMPRMVLSVMGHASYGMVMGAFVGRAHFTSDGVQRRKLMAMGLGGAILLHALVATLVLTKEGWLASLALLVNGFGLYWGRKLFKALRDEQDRLFYVLDHRAKVLAAGGTGPEQEAEIEWAGVPSQPPLERTYWAWAKLGLGGLGLCFCGLLWFLTISYLHERHATFTAGDYFGWGLIALLFAALPTWLSFLLFRSGLREPLESSPVS